MRHACACQRAAHGCACSVCEMDILSLRRPCEPVLLQLLLPVGCVAKRAVVQPKDLGVAMLQSAGLLAGACPCTPVLISVHSQTRAQVAYAGSLRSSAVTLDYFQNQCNAAFGRKMTQDTDAFNAKYGGFRPNATRVIALNGRYRAFGASSMCRPPSPFTSLTLVRSDDPWRRTCVKKSLNPLYVENTATCDGCGHCGDLRGVSPTEAPAITAQHAFVDTYVAAWVKAAAEERGI